MTRRSLGASLRRAPLGRAGRLLLAILVLGGVGALGACSSARDATWIDESIGNVPTAPPTER